MPYQASPSKKPPEPRNLLYIFIWVFSLLFGWFLSKRKAPVKQPVNGQQPQDTSARAGDRRQDVANPPLRVMIESFPPGPIPEKHWNSKERSKNRREWGQFIISVGTLLVVAIYTCVSWRQWRTMDRTFSEMQKQTVAIQSQLEVTDRPWLKVSFTAEGQGFHFDGGGAGLSLRAHIQNIGHSVATGVIIPNEMFLPSDASGSIFKEPIEHQSAICGGTNNKAVGSAEDQKQQNEMLAMVIFPGDINESHTIGMAISKSEIDARKNQVPEGPGFTKVPGGKRIIPYIVGCVDYEFGTSTHHHQTRFIYEVERRIQVAPNVYPFVMIDVTEQVPASNVALTEYGFGGFVAN
jgi:hypothetical protein